MILSCQNLFLGCLLHVECVICNNWERFSTSKRTYLQAFYKTHPSKNGSAIITSQNGWWKPSKCRIHFDKPMPSKVDKHAFHFIWRKIQLHPNSDQKMKKKNKNNKFIVYSKRHTFDDWRKGDGNERQHYNTEEETASI